MKAQLIGKKLNTGFATLEILIAFAVVILCISAVIMVSFGNQSVTIDSQTNIEAISKAQALLEKARADSRSDFGSVVTTSVTPDDIYQKQTVVDPATLTECSKDVKSNVSWISGSRTLNVNFLTHLGDIATAVALGGNCDTTPPSPGWVPPATWASSNFNPGKPTGLDAFNRIVYMTADKTPFLFIADTNGVAHGTSSGLFVPFTNGFNDSTGYASYKKTNDIKIARYSDGKIYAFIARDTGTNAGQFEVIDVTDIHKPSGPTLALKAIRSLAGVSGAQPQGWRLYYFDNKVFIVTEFTAGPELHIFDVSTPLNPVEIGTGTDLGRTVESLVIRKKIISNTMHYFAYMATDKNTAPISVYDIVFPTSSTVNVSEVTSAEPSFALYQDGQSVYVVGNTLYFGRTSDPSGSDLFVYNISNPLSGSALPLLGQADIGTSVIGLAASGPFTFLATTKNNKEFQVWNSNPSNITLVSTFNFPNVIYNGLKYENNWVYVSSQGNDALRIIYNNL